MDRIIYRVDKDISLEEIAEKFNTTPSAISKLNNLDGEIFVGLRLLIEPREGSYYTVQPFDTVASIAKKFGVSEDAIREDNSDRIFIGQRIFVCSAEKQTERK